MAGDRFQRILKLKKTADSRYIYQKELDCACFQQDIAYGVYRDLLRKASEKELHVKVFVTSSNPKYHGYQRGLATRVYNFFSRKSQIYYPHKNRDYFRGLTQSILIFQRLYLGC